MSDVVEDPFLVFAGALGHASSKLAEKPMRRSARGSTTKSRVRRETTKGILAAALARGQTGESNRADTPESSPGANGRSHQKHQ